MDSFMCVFLLGLLTLGHASPLPTMTQIHPVDDVFREVLTDGFILDETPKLTLTTQLPSTETTPYSPTISDRATTRDNSTAVGEAAEAGETAETTAAEAGETSVAKAEVKESTGVHAGDIVEARETTEAEAEEPVAAEGGESSLITAGTENNPIQEVDISMITNMMEGFSGEGPTIVIETFTSPTDGFRMFSAAEGSGMTEEPLTTTAATTTAAAIIIVDEIQGRGLTLGSEKYQETLTIETPQMPESEATEVAVSSRKALPLENVTTMAKGHVTPDWVIILGFLVGVAVLVLLCVAVATRDKWNGPNQFNQTGITLEPSDQQRAVEMETFLHNEQPKENGRAEEYSVIPLEELPNSYTS